MKKMLFALFAILVCGKFANAQVPVDSNKKVVYTEVVNVANVTKDVLYDKAMITLNEIYKEVASKMDKQDKVAGAIEMRCSTRVMLKDPKTGGQAFVGFIKYKLKLQLKDGKYKYTFYDFHIDKGGYKKPIEQFVEKYHEVTAADRADEQLAFLDKDIRSVIEKLKAGLSSQKVEQKSDW